MPDTTRHWDIFCNVIDNYGDIGVTWRLARQLAREHDLTVRLWVDDLYAFQHICPEVDCTATTQFLRGVEIKSWTTPLPSVEPGGVVIEALACHLPDTFIQTMARKSPTPVWINLEYLSAENWVTGVHKLPSPHPRLPLTQYFFMPGFIPGTGGLLRERDLCDERSAFQVDRAAQTSFWAALGLPDKDKDTLRISLFSYACASLPGLLDACSRGKRLVEILVPQGKATPQIADWISAKGGAMRCGALRVYFLPMLSQEDYDHLLWLCDFNLVRGEDSFVRAQFAARPLIWQAYRQEEGAHLDKLAAFLDLYCTTLPPEASTLLRAVWQAWNQEGEIGPLWAAWIDSLPRLSEHAQKWATRLSDETDLAANLVKFSDSLLQ